MDKSKIYSLKYQEQKLHTKNINGLVTKEVIYLKYAIFSNHVDASVGQVCSDKFAFCVPQQLIGNSYGAVLH